MSAAWTDMLVDPLARVLRGRDWRRVDLLRNGRWIALADEGESDVSWYVLDLDGAVAEPLSLADDRDLRRAQATAQGIRVLV